MSSSTMALATLESILQGASAGVQAFAPNSRYYGIPTTTMTLPDGSQVSYLTRRFVPAPERFRPLQRHVVAEGDRLDSLAAKYFNDPLLFWRICDANRALRPGELVETVGERLRITLAEDVPSPTGGT
ncbi:MAG: LysM domain-containing protein [Luteibacter sp.]